MKTHHIIITVLLVVLTAPGCSREETASLPGGPLELVASVPYFDIETKAGEEFTDEVTAYPLAGTALAADPVLQSYAASGSYFFNIPGGADNIVFTTVEAAPITYTASMDFVNGSISVSAAEGQPVGRDLIFGWLQNYSAGQTQAATDLRRASARLNISLKAIYGVDTVSNLSSTFQSAEVTVSGMHTSAVLEYQTLKYSYSGEGNVAFPLNQDENGVYAARIMTLPSTGTTTPVLTLTLTTTDGSVRSYSSPLPSSISTNYSYNMNLLLSWDNASADFTLSDIQMNTVEMDGIPSQSFDLLRFSHKLLMFSQNEGHWEYLDILESRFGTWKADIPAEALEYFSFRNETNGIEATVENPDFYGEEGDHISVHTLQTNNTGGYIRFSIPFSISDGENTYTYYLDIIQSDGSTQSIEYRSDAYHYLSLNGQNITFISFDESGNADTLSDGTSGIWGNQEIGHYKICGEFITSLRLDNADLTAFTFNNCTMLNDLTTYSCTGDISSIDLSSAENLEKLDIDFNDTQITSIDLTHNTYLKNINIEINTLTELTLPPASDKLETLTLSNAGNLTELNASGHTGLRTLSLSSMNALTSLDLSDCTSLTQVSIPSGMTSLSSLQISGCTSLKKFDVWGEIPLESLDFSGCEFLDDIQLRYNPTITSITVPGARDISYLLIDGLSALTELNIAGSNVDYLNLHNCDGIQSINFNQQNIKRLRAHHCDALTGINLASNSTIRSLFLENNYKLDAVDLSHSCMDSLYIYDCNSVSSLNLDGCSYLTYLKLDNSNISAFNSVMTLSLPALEELQIINCPLSSLNVAEGNRLKKVSLSSNSSLKFINTDLNATSTLEELRIESCSQSSDGSIPRDSINLSGYSALRLVSIRNCYNYTYGASFEGCTSLTDLRLQYNYQLENLDLSGCTSLRTMDLYENNLGSAVLTSVLESLPGLSGTSGGQYCIRYNLPEDNNYSSIQTGIDSAADRGWTLSEEMLPDLDFSFNYN